jgi:hypothetical protein
MLRHLSACLIEGFYNFGKRYQSKEYFSSGSLSDINFSFPLGKIGAVSKEQIYRNTPLKPLKNVQFCSSSRKAKILTTGIYLIFRGLKFEPDVEIGQKGAFFKGFTIVSPHKSP